MVGIRTAIIAAVLVVSVPAHGEPQEDDAYLDKQRGIAFEMQAPFGDRTLPIRLTPMTATCRVPPLSRVKLGIGWSRGVARDAEQ